MTPTERVLLKRLRGLLGGGIRVRSLAGYHSLSDTYEAYVFSLVVKAIWRKRGVRPSYLPYPKLMLFRRGPREIWTPYTRAVFSSRGGDPELEVHQAVYVRGKSDVPHECDVLVVDWGAADFSRRYSDSPWLVGGRYLNPTPRFNRAVVAIECKCYASAVDLGPARAMVGLARDFPSTSSFFVASTSLSPNAETLQNSYRVKPSGSTTPGSPEERDLLKKLRAHF